MLQIVVWAMATGFVTGAVWFAILFFRRHPVKPVTPPLPPSPDPDPKLVDDMQRRLLELEERLDATEYQMKRDRVEEPREPPR